MNTRLSRLCEAIIEAGWLAALIIVPLFFNVHSSRVFEPDKLSLLRSIALVMAATWLVKLFNDGFRLSGETEAGEEQSSVGLWQRIRQTPLVLPTLLLVLIYLVSTLLSVAPRISWWGSYQRLQGTYSTYSYIIIFFLALGHLRRPEQWRRITYVVILTSLPIAIYGILQRLGVDPLPWGGPTQRRVASNMGNSIFVAAYLLMAFYLTLQRMLEHFSRLLREQEGSSAVADAVLAGCYLFIIVVQFVTMVLFTQSRGPLLGWLAGLYVFGLLGALGLRAWAGSTDRVRGPWKTVLRSGWLVSIVFAVAVVAFQIIFSLPNSPLASLRDNPYIGRLGTALDFESQTARVRTLIWEGAADLVPPHDPLEYPATGGVGDPTAMTADAVNGLRPLIGYGPETMWVAFNRFYPPDLAHYEARNASPDRSHNETWDSLVITGLFGFLAYMVLFLTLFYHSLKWLGLIRTSGQRWLFLLLAVIFGLAGAVVPYLLQGSWILSGLTGPIALIGGIVIYITLAAIWNERQGLPMRLGQREFLIITLLATVIAHFVEIHFGIAIAATRTYFWLFSAALVVIGMGWLQLEGPQAVPEGMAASPEVVSARDRGRRGRSGRGRSNRRRRPASSPTYGTVTSRSATGGLPEALVMALLLGIILFTLAYDFIVVPNVGTLRDQNPAALFWHALTSKVEGTNRVTSLGIFWMIAFTWLVGTAVALFTLARDEGHALNSGWLARAGGLLSGSSLGIFVILGLTYASRLARDVRLQQVPSNLTADQRLERLDQISDSVAGHISTYYLLAFLLLIAVAVLIWRQRPSSTRWLGQSSWIGPAGGAVFLALAAVVISAVNVNLVQADVVYKQGQAFDSARQYDDAVFLYEKAIDQQPSEDYYYLFLGRSQLEQARVATGALREQRLQEAEGSLLKAQELNPLNTDHTANLGRLYLTWAQMETGDLRQQLLDKSLAYYQVATSLSPNAAHLHNEYASAYQLDGELDKAREQLDFSLSLDQKYADTYRRLGDLYRTTGEDELAIEILEKGLELSPRDIQLHSTLGLLYAQQNNLPKAIEHNLAVVEVRPNDLASNRNLALLYRQAGRFPDALVYARRALELTTNDAEKPSLEALIGEIQAQIGG